MLNIPLPPLLPLAIAAAPPAPNVEDVGAENDGVLDKAVFALKVN